MKVNTLPPNNLQSLKDLGTGGLSILQRTAIEKLIKLENLTPQQQKARQQLAQTADLESQLRTHNKKRVRISEASHYFKMVRGILTEGKAKRHEAYFDIQPLPTFGLMSEIKTVYKGVFDPRHKRVSISGSDGDIKKFNEYLSTIKLSEFIQNEVFDAYFSDYGGFIVGDMPNRLNGANSPFLYIVPTSDVILYERDDLKDVTNWIIYKRGNDYVFLNDTYFVVFDADKNFKSESMHNAGITPCFKMYAMDSVTASEAGNFDKALWKSLDNDKMHDVNSSAVSWSYRSHCDYKRVISDEILDSCNGGDIHRRQNGKPSIPTGEKCPKCATDLSGAGTHIYMSMPEGDDKTIAAPFGYIFPPVETLKYNNEHANNLFKKIKENICGGDIQMAINGQAFNEKQVSSMIEEKRNILTIFGQCIGRAEAYCMEILSAIMFDKKLDVYVDYGNDFFNVTEGELYTIYTEAVENDATINMKKQLYDNWAQTKNRHSKTGYLRDKIIASICPYFHEKNDRVLTYLSSQMVDPNLVYLKLNFTEILSEYEQNNEIIELMTTDYDSHVIKLKEELINIVNKKRNGQQEPE